MGRYTENGQAEGKNIVRIHPELRREIQKIQDTKPGLPFTRASYEIIEQKRQLEEQNRDYQKRIQELLSSNNRRTRLL